MRLFKNGVLFGVLVGLAERLRHFLYIFFCVRNIVFGNEYLRFFLLDYLFFFLVFGSYPLNFRSKRFTLCGKFRDLCFGLLQVKFRLLVTCTEFLGLFFRVGKNFFYGVEPVCPKRQFESHSLFSERKIFSCFLRLLFKRSEPCFKFGSYIFDTGYIVLRLRKSANAFVFFVLELRNTRRLFEKHASVGGLCRDYFCYRALSDYGIARFSETGISQKFLNVA